MNQNKRGGAMSKRKMLVAGNWKMNKSYAEAVNLAQQLSYSSKEWEVESCVCPTHLALKAVANVFAFDHAPIKFGAQNVFWEEDGAYTGEISASMLKDLGCSFCIVGHSERRELFSEGSEQIARKAFSLIQQGICPIVCCGEPLSVYEQAGATEYVARQVREVLEILVPQLEAAGISLTPEKLVLAYEPIWAIGSGKVATPEYANKIAERLRAELATVVSEDLAAGVRILYGGSVKAANAGMFFEQEHIDGALVGGAALIAEDFSEIVKQAGCVA